MSNYHEFIERKSQIGQNAGFEPTFVPDSLFDFQRHIVEWSVRKGRCLVAADCGMGKTLMQLAWAQNVVEKTNKPVMLATPIAVGPQTVKEAERFGISAKRTRDGLMTDEACVWVTNYEQLHKYDPLKFGGMVADESSCIKDFKSQRKGLVVEFMRNMLYRSLWTATAAPNDFWELGTSSEALGWLGFRDMLTIFFKQEQQGGHHGWARAKYRFRGHAEQPFWQWVCSFALSLRKPSDLGFDDSRFVLPELNEREVICEVAKPRKGMLFPMAARNRLEELEDRRNTITERCEAACEIADNVDGPCALWCELNPEGDLLEKLLGRDVVQIKGSMSDDEKEESLIAFSSGQIKRIVTKPKIGAWGLNWQHCADTVVFPSHSFEQYYQLIHRFYRFGQTKPVNVSLVLGDGQQGVIKNLERKRKQCERMFDSIVRHMNNSRALMSNDFFPTSEERPSWLVSNN